MSAINNGSKAKEALSESKTMLVNEAALSPVLSAKDIEAAAFETSAGSSEFSSSSSDSSGDDDPWLVADVADKSIPWRELSTGGRVRRVLWDYCFRQVALIGFLYLFICSLDFLSSAFRLLAGKAAGQGFKDNELLQNPIAGLMMGVVATVLLQSSSTTTSIVVSMVGSGLLTVKIAIPIVMGANIGTSVTNTIVSIGQAADRSQFRRAFGAATVHDMFNWLSVLVFLPLEMATGYLNKLSELIVESLPLTQYKDGKVKLLKALTEPLTHFVVKVDSNAIKKIAKGENFTGTMIKTVCKKASNTTEEEKCRFMFEDVAGDWPDWLIGLILLIFALIVLCTCLVLIVKILNSIFKGPIARLLKKFVNADMPSKCGQIATGYVAILIGTAMTILVQSSSVFTSTLTPLVGLGVITIDRVYPLTLGSNIGTTFTSILSSLAQDTASNTFKSSLQISMCHLFFNISGILLWYPLPFMRFPIAMAKKLGDTTAKYRWFAILYLIIAFFLFPGGMFGLTMLNAIVAYSVAGILVLFIIIITVINVLQTKKPNVLSDRLKTWNWLPRPLHSLKPLDNLVTKCIGTCRCCRRFQASQQTNETEKKTPSLSMTEI